VCQDAVDRRERMKNPSGSELIEYGVCSPSDVDAMAELLAEVFSRSDPPAVAAGLTPREFGACVQLFCPKAGREGLTIVARLAESGDLVGALLTEDGSSVLPDGVERLSPKFDPIFDIMGQLDEEYRGDSEVGHGEHLHLFLLGVSPRVAGRGVAQELVRVCLKNGSRLGYLVAVTEATNKASQHIFRKAGLVERVERSYKTHRFDGRAVFASIAEQGGPILMDKPLSS
jgi:ribosomal protein S18 acetylase RimI-like enzyme